MVTKCEDCKKECNKIPTEPGYYWLFIKSISLWEIVEVFEKIDGELVFNLLGTSSKLSVSRFSKWGPKIEPPKYM